jgi:hypothetical protein
VAKTLFEWVPARLERDRHARTNSLHQVCGTSAKIRRPKRRPMNGPEMSADHTDRREFALAGTRCHGTATAHLNLRSQLPLIAPEFPEVADCHPGTINLLLDQGLLVVRPDHRTRPIPWHPNLRGRTLRPVAHRGGSAQRCRPDEGMALHTARVSSPAELALPRVAAIHANRARRGCTVHDLRGARSARASLCAGCDLCRLAAHPRRTPTRATAETCIIAC